MSCSTEEIGKKIHKYERAADKSSKVFTLSSCKSSEEFLVLKCKCWAGWISKRIHSIWSKSPRSDRESIFNSIYTKITSTQGIHYFYT